MNTTSVTDTHRPADNSRLRIPTHPETFRLPRQRECDPWWGGNRSFWNEKILPSKRNNWTPQIRSRIVRQPGAKKAVRFIIWESAAEYFRKIDEATAREFREIRFLHATADEQKAA
jgi:hypothetical protein